MKKITSIVWNKYFLVSVLFLAWMLFFDQRDLLYVHQQRKKLEAIEQKKEYYQKEADSSLAELKMLIHNPATMEKYARERYKMKKNNEEIFIIDNNDSTSDQNE